MTENVDRRIHSVITSYVVDPWESSHEHVPYGIYHPAARHDDPCEVNYVADREIPFRLPQDERALDLYDEDKFIDIILYVIFQGFFFFLRSCR
jgi:hypothetical protein